MPRTECPGRQVARSKLTHHRGALSPVDAALIQQWGASLRAAGWAPSSVERTAKRIRALARGAPDGLLHATPVNVAELAGRRAAARGCTLTMLMRSASWAKTARALTAFYGWLESRGLIDPRQNPLRGMRRLPPVSRPVAAVPARLARHYDALLHDPALSPRDRALLLALAHGVEVHEAVRLRVDDVNAEARLFRVAGPRQPGRLLPLSERAAGVLGAWVRQQARVGAVWLFDRAAWTQRNGVRPLERSAVSGSVVRTVVRRAALRVFPHPRQAPLRRRLHAGGFADVFRTRLARSRLPVHLAASFLAVDRILIARLCGVAPVTLAQLHREWRRLTARRRWI